MTADPDSTGAVAAGAAFSRPRGKGWWIRRGAILLAAAFAAVVAFAYVLPREPEVTRQIDIALPAGKVFPLIADLRRFPEWLPWFVADPAIAITFTGPLDGAGQTLAWRSAMPEVGWGHMTMTRTEKDRAAEIEIHFADQGTAKSWLRLEPKDAATTTVRWGFSTDLGFSPLNRYSGLWIGNIVGPDFERGLARLKALAETLPKSG